jgi:peroxiredoxin
MVRFASTALVAFVSVAALQAAPLKIGSAAPKFNELQCATMPGKSASLDSFKDKDVVVYVITCNHCPVAKAYEDRLIDFAKKYTGKDKKVALVAFSVNTSEADSMDHMKERAKEKGFNFPYLYDGSQQIAKELGATSTPEFFVFNKDRKLVYTGAMDDSMNAEKVTKHYVEDAVSAALKGDKPATETTKAVGCGIQWATASKSNKSGN